MQQPTPNPAVTALESQWLDAFRAGDYGEKGSYTAADLDSMVANFNPSFHEPPVVVGHPQTDAPAYGWVGAIRRAGDALQVKLRQVDPGFAELVQAGRFKKRSVSLYKTAEGWALRHLGFLGAEPPHLKGLADARFREETNNEVAEVTFEENAMQIDAPVTEGNLMTTLKKILGISEAAQAAPAAQFSESDVKRIVADAIAAATAPLQAKVTEFEAQFGESAKRQRAQSVEQRVEAAVAKLKSAGKWIPAFDKMGLRVVFAELAKLEGTVEFGEGDSKVTATPLDIQASFMEKLARIAPFTPDVYVPANLGGAPAPAQFTESRSKASSNSVMLDQLTRQRMSDKSINYSDALTQVAREHPELTVVGGSSAGEV